MQDFNLIVAILKGGRFRILYKIISIALLPPPLYPRQKKKKKKELSDKLLENLLANIQLKLLLITERDVWNNF